MTEVDLAGQTVLVRSDEPVAALGEAVQLWTRRFHVFRSNGRTIARITSV